MTNKIKISLVLGIMCFLLTLGICVQIKTVKNSNSTVSNNYEENSLRAEVLKYKEKYDNKYKELEKELIYLFNKIKGEKNETKN